MTNMPQAPVSLGRSYRVYLNGKELPDYMLQSIESIEVENSRTDADSANIRVQDVNLLFTKGDLLVKGTNLVIRMGHHARSRTVFEGKITHLESDFGPDSPPSLVVNGHDMDVEEFDKQRTRTFNNKRVSDVIIQMLKEAGLRPTVQKTTKVYSKIVQKEESNRDFIKRWVKVYRFHQYKTGRNRYYVGSKPFSNPKPKSIGYRSGGHEIIRATPSFVNLDNEQED